VDARRCQPRFVLDHVPSQKAAVWHCTPPHSLAFLFFHTLVDAAPRAVLATGFSTWRVLFSTQTPNFLCSPPYSAPSWLISQVACYRRLAASVTSSLRPGRRRNSLVPTAFVSSSCCLLSLYACWDAQEFNTDDSTAGGITPSTLRITPGSGGFGLSLLLVWALQCD
jgi:hypothetical protein